MNDDGEQAREILEKAMAVRPDNPGLKNNLAMAYEMLGHRKKAFDLIQQIHTRFPDYFFGILGVARLEIKEHDLDTAHSQLAKLLERKRMYVTEFDELCMAQIELCLAEKNKEAARNLFKMLERTDPENPKLEFYRIPI